MAKQNSSVLSITRRDLFESGLGVLVATRISPEIVRAQEGGDEWETTEEGECIEKGSGTVEERNVNQAITFLIDMGKLKLAGNLQEYLRKGKLCKDDLGSREGQYNHMNNKITIDSDVLNPAPNDAPIEEFGAWKAAPHLKWERIAALASALQHEKYHAKQDYPEPDKEQTAWNNQLIELDRWILELENEAEAEEKQADKFRRAGAEKAAQIYYESALETYLKMIGLLGAKLGFFRTYFKQNFDHYDSDDAKRLRNKRNETRQKKQEMEDALKQLGALDEETEPVDAPQFQSGGFETAYGSYDTATELSTELVNLLTGSESLWSISETERITLQTKAYDSDRWFSYGLDYRNGGVQDITQGGVETSSMAISVPAAVMGEIIQSSTPERTVIEAYQEGSLAVNTAPATFVVIGTVSRGNTITVLVEENGERVANAFVLVDSQEAGRTDSQGQISVTVPDTSQMTLEAQDTNEQGRTIGERTLQVDPPTAAVDWSPLLPIAGQAVTFDGGNSQPGASQIAEYEWTVDGESLQSGTEISHAFEDAGTYKLTLTVTDEDGNTDTTSERLFVEDRFDWAPVAAFTAPSTVVTPGENVSFDAAPSRNLDTETASYEWFLDGERFGSGQQLEHTFENPGTYTVTLAVTDDSDRRDEATVSIQVVAPPEPAFRVETESPTASEQVVFDAEPSTAPDTEIISYEWRFGQSGTFEEGEKRVIHTFDTAGEYSVALRVTDDADQQGVVEQTITVAERATRRVEETEDEEENQTLTETPDTATPIERDTPTVTDSSGPGFGPLAAIGGLAGGTLLKWVSDRENDEQ
jgi:PKD repeat protein